MEMIIAFNFWRAAILDFMTPLRCPIVSNKSSLRTGSQRGRKKNLASESERRDSVTGGSEWDAGVVLAGHSVAMVTYCVTEIIPTCSPVIGQFLVPWL